MSGMGAERRRQIKESAWSARARATSSTGWMMRYALDAAALLEALEAAEAERDEARRQGVNGCVTCAKAADEARAETTRLETENARLRALLAEDVALLEELDAAWGGAGS